MNYIEQVRGFWRAHEEHSFSTTEVAVYFYLVEVCNICHWKNPFKRNNAKIGADLGISFNTLKNARNRLRQTGLIDFKTTNGSSNVLYTLSNFDKVTNEVSAEVGNEVSNEVSNEVLPSKYKLNKTKHTPLTPKGDAGEVFFDLDLLHPPADDVKRNLNGLKIYLRQLGFTDEQKKIIIDKMNYGEIGHPLWRVFSGATGDASIKHPAAYVMSELKKI